VQSRIEGYVKFVSALTECTLSVRSSSRSRSVSARASEHSSLCSLNDSLRCALDGVPYYCSS
jgi:hypothetical protein